MWARETAAGIGVDRYGIYHDELAKFDGESKFTQRTSCRSSPQPPASLERSQAVDLLRSR
jgi:hypothetical protein